MPHWINDIDYPKASFDVAHMENCPILASDCGHCQHILNKGIFYYAKHYIYIFIPFYLIMLIDDINDYYNKRQVMEFIKNNAISPTIYIFLLSFILAKFTYNFIKKSRYLANFRALNIYFKIYILSSRLNKVDNELLDRKATITAISRFL